MNTFCFLRVVVIKDVKYSYLSRRTILRLLRSLWQIVFQSQNVKFFCSHSDDFARSDAGLRGKEHKTVVWGFFCRNHGDNHHDIVSDHLQAAAKLETTFLSGVLLSFQMCYFPLKCVTFLSGVLLSFQVCYFLFNCVTFTCVIKRTILSKTPYSFSFVGFSNFERYCTFCFSGAIIMTDLS